MIQKLLKNKNFFTNKLLGKIKTIKDTLHSFPTGTNMDLEYMVDLGKQSQKNYRSNKYY